MRINPTKLGRIFEIVIPVSFSFTPQTWCKFHGMYKKWSETDIMVNPSFVLLCISNKYLKLLNSYRAKFARARRTDEHTDTWNHLQYPWSSMARDDENKKFRSLDQTVTLFIDSQPGRVRMVGLEHYFSKGKEYTGLWKSEWKCVMLHHTTSLRCAAPVQLFGRYVTTTYGRRVTWYDCKIVLGHYKLQYPIWVTCDAHMGTTRVCTTPINVFML